jgi:6-phosphofructokinase 1
MCLKSLVYRLVDLGFEPIGVRKGWEGLIQYNPRDPSTYSDYFIELTKNVVRPIDRTPGSFLHSSRLEPRRLPADCVPEFLKQAKQEEYDLTGHIKEVVQLLDFHGLIVIGDDDMLNYAAYLSQQGVPVIGIPKTIHNNIPGTDYTLGFSTGLSRGVALIHELRALAGSREQFIVIETFAAKSGLSTLLIGLLAGVDRVLIPEVPYDPERLAYLMMQDKRKTPANYAVMLVCDGARIQAEQVEHYAEVISNSSGSRLLSPRYLKSEALAEKQLVGSGVIAAQLLSHLTGEGVFQQELTYLLRTGTPDGQDLLGAMNFAFIAAELVAKGQYGQMATFQQGKMWTQTDLKVASEGVKLVDVDAWYDLDNYAPKLSLIWSAPE